MTGFQIKIIATITMVIDHIGLFFFPQYEILRIIGRLAFPLFAWLIANGAYHTHNIKKYLLRLFFLAVISQIPFTLTNQKIGSPLFYLNVVFTLFFGLLAIHLINKTRNKFLWIIVTLSCAGIADIIHSDYGAAGVFSIIAFYIFFNNKIYTFISQTIILFIIPLIIFFCEEYSRASYSLLYLDSKIEAYGLISLIFIILYKNKKETKANYLFYIFYPLQYMIIFLLKLF